MADKVTSEGAESLRKNFVDQSIYANLLKEKETLSTKVEEISSSFETQLSKLADKQASLSQKTKDTSPINENARSPINLLMMLNP